MKKGLLCLLPLLLVLCKTAPVSDEKKNELLKEANYIVLSLEKMIKSDTGNKSKITGIVNEMYKKMDNKELFINIDFKKPENIYEGASFDVPVNRSENPYLSISPYLINLYRKQPSIVYSILVHEFTHAYSFFKDKEGFMKAHQDDLELYLFEMDASYIEGLFIKDFLIPREFQLTNYEKFLTKSLDDDNLSTYSIYLRSVDRDLTYALYRIVDEDGEAAEKFKNIELLGDKLLKDLVLDDKENEWIMYCSFITYASYIKFVPEIVLRIAHNDLVKRKKSARFNISDYPGIEKVIVEMSRKIEPYRDEAYSYHMKLSDKLLEL